MLREEFSRLIYLYQQAAEGKGASVQEVFQKSIEFIEDLKKQLKEGDEEDRKAALRMMNELYQHMRNHTKIMCEKAGMTEEQLMAKSENPKNFSPEMWNEMQESKNRLAKAGQDLVQLIQFRPEPKGALPSPAAMISKDSAARKGPRKKGTKKSDWMRS